MTLTYQHELKILKMWLHIKKWTL